MISDDPWPWYMTPQKETTTITRWFSNHESRLLSRSHTFAIIVILDLKIHQSMWIHWPFFPKNLNQRSFTPRWPLTPCLLRSYVWLYPRIIVSKSHDNTSMYVDTVINFAKYHIHTTYILLLHTEWVNTWHSLLLNSVQARQKPVQGTPNIRTRQKITQSLSHMLPVPLPKKEKDICGGNELQIC